MNEEHSKPSDPTVGSTDLVSRRHKRPETWKPGRRAWHCELPGLSGLADGVSHEKHRHLDGRMREPEMR